MERITVRSLSSSDKSFPELYELYRSIFTSADEAEDMDGICASLALVGNPPLVAEYGCFEEYWIAAFYGGKIVGGANFTVFHGCETIHINYLFTAPSFRNNGIGSLLLEAICDTAPDYPVFCEQNDPALMSPEQYEADMAATGVSPEQRTSWWRRRGFRKIDFRYIQPSLTPDVEPCDIMSLFVQTDKEYLEASTLKEHLRRFYYISVLKNRTEHDKLTDALVDSCNKQAVYSLA